MKTILLILYFGIAFGQPVKITMVNPGILCPGDTMNVYFTWNNSIGLTNFNMNCSLMNQIWSEQNNSFYSLPKFIVNIDTVYLIKLFTHSFWASGFSALSTDLINTIPVYFNYCLLSTGISVQNLSQEPATYYDLNGSLTKPQPGRVLVEKRGNVRRKVVLLE